jgi:hypothetical protein
MADDWFKECTPGGIPYAILHETQAFQEGENMVQWMYLLISIWTLILPLQSSQMVTEATTEGSDISSLQLIDVQNDHSLSKHRLSKPWVPSL